jgi:hypothetical protein
MGKMNKNDESKTMTKAIFGHLPIADDKNQPPSHDKWFLDLHINL